MNTEYMLIPAFCARTGYSEKAVRMKIAGGVWIEGMHYRRAPDGHITMDMIGYYKWVEGARVGSKFETPASELYSATTAVKPKRRSI